jgi:hypothetical protein
MCVRQQLLGLGMHLAAVSVLTSAVAGCSRARAAAAPASLASTAAKCSSRSDRCRPHPTHTGLRHRPRATFLHLDGKETVRGDAPPRPT